LFHTINAVGLTDIGLKRKQNQDIYALQKNFFVLADGMGGPSAGQIAASHAVAFLCSEVQKENFKKTPFFLITKKLRTITKLTHEHVKYIASLKKSYKGMGTTMSSLLFVKNYLYISHVGDSRVYRLREKKLDLISIDHTKLTPSKQCKGGVQLQRKCLTQAVGSTNNFDPMVKRYKAQISDRYLICSDGLTDLIEEKELQEHLLNEDKLEALSETLIEEAKSRGGHDNITVVLLDLN
jgi:PPM family protein phosphatase